MGKSRAVALQTSSSQLISKCTPSTCLSGEFLNQIYVHGQTLFSGCVVAAFQFVYTLCARKWPLSGPGHGEEFLHIIELCEQSVGLYGSF